MGLLLQDFAESTMQGELNYETELSLKIVKSAPVWAGFGALHKRGLVQNQIIEGVVYSNTLSIKWFSYCSNVIPTPF